METPEYLTKRAAVQFIVDRVEKPQYEDKRAWRNKINLRLTRDKTITLEEGKYRLNNVLIHTRKWYGVINGYPVAFNLTCEAGAYVVGISIKGASGFAYSTPGNLEECQALIRELYKENYKLNDEIKKRDDEIARLKPLADKYLKNCAINQNNARKPRYL